MTGANIGTNFPSG